MSLSLSTAALLGSWLAAAGSDGAPVAPPPAAATRLADGAENCPSHRPNCNASGGRPGGGGRGRGGGGGGSGDGADGA